MTKHTFSKSAWYKTKILAPIVAALIFVFGPYLTLKLAPVETLEYLPDNTATQSLLSMTGRTRQPYGMGRAQFLAFIAACEEAHVAPLRIMQTIGNARASAGYHKRDGYAVEGGVRRAYCAATDVDEGNLSRAQIRRFLSALADKGFVGWYRYRPPFSRNRHIHFVYVGYPMKRQLRSQFASFLADRDGLAGNRRETFWQATAAQKKSLKAKYYLHPSAKKPAPKKKVADLGGFQMVSLIAPAAAATPAPPAISVSGLHSVTLELKHVKYTFGGKAALGATPGSITGLDCSGFTTYAGARSSGQTFILPAGSQYQRAWLEARGFYRLRQYSDLKYAAEDSARLFIAFILATDTHAGHVWFVNGGRTYESATDTYGVGSLPWNNSYRLKRAAATYELPTRP